MLHITEGNPSDFIPWYAQCTWWLTKCHFFVSWAKSLKQSDGLPTGKLAEMWIYCFWLKLKTSCCQIKISKTVQCNRHHVQNRVRLNIEMQFLKGVFFYSICSSVKKLLTSRVHWYGPLKKNKPKAGTFTEMQFCFALLLSLLRSGEFVGRPCFCHKKVFERGVDEKIIQSHCPSLWRKRLCQA